MYRLSLTANIEAAHRSSQLGSDRPRRDEIHGHSYLVTVSLGADNLDERGVVHDIEDLKDAMTSLCEPLDHALLNDVDGLDHPTMEAMARFIFDRAKARKLPVIEVDVSRPTLGFSARYSG